MRLCNVLCVSLLMAVAGCPPPPGGGGNDMGSPDLSVPPAPDQGGPPGPDLSANAPDLSGTSPDLAVILPDLMKPPPADLMKPPADMRSPLSVIVGAGGGTAFDPKQLEIKVGQTVTWIWAASGHNVVSGNPATGTIDNKFCSPNDMECSKAPTSNEGDTYQHTFTTAGTYTYFCAPHRMAGMAAAIVVK